MCADGEIRTYSDVDVLLVASFKDEAGNEWRAERHIRSGEHWEPAIEQAADKVSEEHGGLEILDLRE